MDKKSSMGFDSMSLFGESINDLLLDDSADDLELNDGADDLELDGFEDNEQKSEDLMLFTDDSEKDPDEELISKTNSNDNNTKYNYYFSKTSDLGNDNKGTITISKFNDIQKNTLNNVYLEINTELNLQEQISDFDKLTPICFKFIDFMIKEGYTPIKESFKDYCIRCLTYFDYIGQEIADSEYAEDSEFSKEEFFAISLFLRTKNIFIDADFMSIYINYPIDFFDNIRFPFRKAEISEISLISKVYGEGWYVPYIIPLFSLEPEHTKLLLDLMQKNKINEKELLKYCKNSYKEKEYLTLKNNNSFVAELFDEIGDNPKNLELYGTLSRIIDNTEILKNLFNRENNEKTEIIWCLKQIDDKNSNVHQIRVNSGNTIDLISVLKEHLNNPFLSSILKGIVKGTYNKELINVLTQNPFGNKSITLGLVDYYVNNENLSKYFDSLHNLFAACIASEIDKFGYDINQFINDLHNNFHDDCIKQMFSIFALKNNITPSITLEDYKQWIALFSINYTKYARVIIDFPDCDVCHFNRFWAKYATKYFGFDDVDIGQDVLRTLVFKFNNSSQINFPLEFFIFMDNKIDEILQKQLKPFIKVIKYDRDNNVLFFGKNSLFGKHSKPQLLFKTSLENVSISDLSSNDFQDKTVLLKYYNLLKVKDNIKNFYQNNEQSYLEKVNNFDKNIKYLITLDYFDYAAYDLVFYAISTLEKEYSLLVCCNDVNVFYECLKMFQYIYFNNSDSLMAFTRFIYGVFGKDFRKVSYCCKSKLISVLNDNRINAIYSNPIYFSVFLKEIDYFRKSAKNTNVTLSLDKSTGGICVDYRLQ